MAVNSVRIACTIKRVLGKGKDHPTNLGKRVARAMYDMGEELLKLSDILIPKDTETALNSGRVRKFGEGFERTVTVGYGQLDDVPVQDWSPKEGRMVTRQPSKYIVILHEEFEGNRPVTGGNTFTAGGGPHHDAPETEFFLERASKQEAELRAVFEASVRGREKAEGAEGSNG